MAFWKKTEEVSEDQVPVEVNLAVRILELIRARPVLTSVKSRTTEDGFELAKQVVKEEETQQVMQELTKEQQDLQGVACLVLNQYLTDYMLQPTDEYV